MSYNNYLILCFIWDSLNNKLIEKFIRNPHLCDLYDKGELGLLKMYLKYFQLQLEIALRLDYKHHISTEENDYLRVTLNFVQHKKEPKLHNSKYFHAVFRLIH